MLQPSRHFGKNHFHFLNASRVRQGPRCSDSAVLDFKTGEKAQSFKILKLCATNHSTLQKGNPVDEASQGVWLRE
jgi:hypothetical protein